ENRSDLANQLILGNDLFKIKRIKQLPLAVIEPPHHRPPPQRIESERANHSARKPLMTFATKSANSGCEQSQQGRRYSITSSAATSSPGGTVRPSARSETGRQISC